MHFQLPNTWLSLQRIYPLAMQGNATTLRSCSFCCGQQNGAANCWRTERKCKLSWLRMLRWRLLAVFVVLVAIHVIVAAVVSSGMAHEYSWRLPGQSFIHS